MLFEPDVELIGAGPAAVYFFSGCAVGGKIPFSRK